MKKLVAVLGIALFPSLAIAGVLDIFAGRYVLENGTEGMNSSGDLICPSPLIFTLSLSALDSNMPQLPLLEVATTETQDTVYTGEISSDGSTLTYKQVTKSGCFLGFFCSTNLLEGSLNRANDTLVLSHSESFSANKTESSGSCTYSSQN